MTTLIPAELSSSLMRIEDATRMLAACTSLEDVRTIRDQAEAMRVYAHLHKLGREAQNYAGTIAIEADIRRGELLREMELSAGGRPPKTGAQSVPVAAPTLAELHTTKRESSNAQAMAQAADEVRAWASTAKIVSPSRAAAIAQRHLHRAEVASAPPLPAGVYDVILADVPWPYGTSGGLPGLAENHYATMTRDELLAFTVPAADNAVLFLWVTNPMLPAALELVTAWGFTYKTNVVWVKRELQRPGIGYYVRGRHELLFICTRGSMVPDQQGRAPIGSVIEAAIGRHSEKPQEAYALIETMYPNGVYLELFARQRRPGWAAWGSDPAVVPGTRDCGSAGADAATRSLESTDDQH